MKQIFETSKFRKDLKRAKKQGKDFTGIKEVIVILAMDENLGTKFRDHSLVGNWKDSRECHIEPDWLLIYRKSEDGLYLERLGSHSELFN